MTMSTTANWSHVLLIACIVTGAAACVENHRDELQALIDRGGTRAEVMKLLGPGYIMYEKNTESWTITVESTSLTRDPEVGRRWKAAVAKYPKVMYYTTAFIMTWVFLDENDVAREFFLVSQ